MPYCTQYIASNGLELDRARQGVMPRSGVETAMNELMLMVHRPIPFHPPNQCPYLRNANRRRWCNNQICKSDRSQTDYTPFIRLSRYTSFFPPIQRLLRCSAKKVLTCPPLAFPALACPFSPRTPRRRSQLRSVCLISFLRDSYPSIMPRGQDALPTAHDPAIVATSATEATRTVLGA